MYKFKKLSIMCFLMVSVLLFGCTTEEIKDPANFEQPNVEEPEQLPIATIEVESFGTIQVELYPHMAPNTVYNFISLANSGFYDGLIIHRIEKDFVLQMGDPNGNGTGGPGYTIKGEFMSNDFNNELLHTKGVISMARSNMPNSAGSQFFIMLEDSPHLDAQYASFGKVIEGMDVAEAIEAVELVSGTSTPKTDVVMTRVTVETFGETYPEPTIIK